MEGNSALRPLERPRAELGALERECGPESHLNAKGILKGEQLHGKKTARTHTHAYTTHSVKTTHHTHTHATHNVRPHTARAHTPTLHTHTMSYFPRALKNARCGCFHGRESCLLIFFSSFIPASLRLSGAGC